MIWNCGLLCVCVITVHSTLMGQHCSDTIGCGTLPYPGVVPASHPANSSRGCGVPRWATLVSEQGCHIVLLCTVSINWEHMRHILWELINLILYDYNINAPC